MVHGWPSELVVVVGQVGLVGQVLGEEVEEQDQNFVSVVVVVPAHVPVEEGRQNGNTSVQEEVELEPYWTLQVVWWPPQYRHAAEQSRG